MFKIKRQQAAGANCSAMEQRPFQKRVQLKNQRSRGNVLKKVFLCCVMFCVCIFVYAQNGYFMQDYVEYEMNKWLQKGEFEKTADWEQRVTEDSRRAKEAELRKEVEQIYIAEFSKTLPTCNVTLIAYNADDEVFLIKHNDGVWLLSVPDNEAQYFKNNWNSHIKTPLCAIINERIALVGMAFTTAYGKTYKCISKEALNSNIYELSPINQTPAKYNYAQPNISSTNSNNVVSQTEQHYYSNSNNFSTENFRKAKGLRNAGVTCFSVGMASWITGAGLLGSGKIVYDVLGNRYWYGYKSNYYAGIALSTIGGATTITGIIMWAVGQKRMNYDGYSLFENEKTQLNLAVGGNSMGVRLNF